MEGKGDSWSDLCQFGCLGHIYDYEAQTDRPGEFGPAQERGRGYLGGLTMDWGGMK